MITLMPEVTERGTEVHGIEKEGPVEEIVTGEEVGTTVTQRGAGVSWGHQSPS